MTFELPLSEERVKSYQVTALHLFVAFILVVTAAVVLAGYYSVSRMELEKAMQFRTLLYYGQAAGLALMIVGLGLLSIILFKHRTLSNSPVGNLILRIFELLLLIGLMVLSIISHVTVPAIVYGVLAATVVFAIYWERMAGNPLIIKVDQSGIRLPVNSRRRSINWVDVDYVLLRFNTLTLNMHDNSMMQYSVGNIDFEKEIFDVYCIRQIEKAKEKGIKNDW